MLQSIADYLGQENRSQLHEKLKWLILARVIFGGLLLVSTIFLQLRNDRQDLTEYILYLYLLVAAIFIVALICIVLLPKIIHAKAFAFLQIAIDSIFVSLIVLFTGGYFSLFSFLYLVVVIYASMILYLRGGVGIALLSSFQYSMILLLQYHSMLPEIAGGAVFESASVGSSQMIFKALITSAASLAIAILGGLLTEQNRRTHKELEAMENHLKRVEKMAYMGEMAAGLAHEIKNPLASLVGSIQLLKEESDYEPGHQRLMDIILRETDRLGTLVNEFLFFARPPAGKPERLNLKTAVEEVCDLFERDATHSKRCILRKEIAENSWVIMDPAHLRQILWNLLLNAAEAVEDNGLIEIKVTKLKNDDICVQVVDNGCGIPHEVVQSIFNPFYTTKAEGTGLGLSIVHRILEAYDGRLDVNTQEGEGTCFSLILNQTLVSH